MRDRVRTLLKRLDPGDWAAFCVGSGGGFLAFGLLEHFFRLFDPTPATWRIVLGASLLAVSAGLWVPHHLAAWLATQTWRRIRGRSSAPLAYSSFLSTRKDRPLHRVVLAGLALLCGGTSILSPGFFRLAQQTHGFLLQEFLWGPLLLVVVECALVIMVALFVFVPVGLTWGCVHHLLCPVGGWRVRPLAGVSTGLAVAGCVASFSLYRDHGLNPDLFLLVGSLPFFLLAILSARLSPGPDRATPEVDCDVNGPIPHIRDRWPVLIRVAVIVAFACAVLSVGIWWRVFRILAAETCHGGAAALTTWSLGFAVGVAAGCALSGRRTHSIGALGLACVLAGAGTALSAGLLGLLGIRAHQLAGYPGGAYLLSAAVVGLSAFGAGHAVTYGGYAALTRAGHRSEVGSALLSRLMLAGAGVVAFVLTPLVLAVGTYAALVAVSLGLVGVGGALIIHEPTYLRKTRRLRLAAVFGSIALMSLALPYAGGEWLVTRPWKRLCLEENAWLTKSIWAVKGDIRTVSEPAGRHLEPVALPFAPVSGGVRRLVDWGAVPGSPRVALLGTGVQPVARAIAAGGLCYDRLLFDPSMLVRARPGSARRCYAVGIGREPATRFLRRTAQRYDAIVIGMGDLPRAAWTPSRRAALLERALNCLRMDGLVLLVVPIGQMPQSELLSCLEALRMVGCTDFTWSSTSCGSQVTLWLAFGKSAQWRSRWRNWMPWVNHNSADLIVPLTGKPSSSPIASRRPGPKKT